MGRLLTPKQRAKVALKVVRASTRLRRRNTQEDPSNDTASMQYLDIGRILRRATKTVFKKAGLNINDSKHWELLLPWLAWSLYGRNPGHPRNWTNKTLRRLQADVARLQSQNPTLTETACCKQLVMETYYLDMGVTKASTLRRRLQQAKKLDLRATK
jgi:hypothetical protein